MSTEQQPTWTPFRRILFYTRPYMWIAVWSIICVISANSFGFAIPWLIKRCIDLLEQPGGADLVPTYAWLIMAAAVAQGLTRWASRVAIFDFNRAVEKDLRSGLFAHLQRMHPTFLQEMPSGDILSRATNDLNNVRMALGMGTMLGFNTLTAYIGSIGMMVFINWRLAIWAILPYPFIILLVRAFGRRMHARYLAVQESLATMSTHLQESYAGHQVVQAYTREAHEIERFQQLNQDYVDKNMEAARYWGMMYPIMATIGGVGTLIVLWVGGRRVISGEMSLGDFVAFNSYLAMLIWPSMALGWVLNLWQRGASAMARIEQLFEARPAIRDRTEDSGLNPKGYSAGRTELGNKENVGIEFRNFSFAYPVRAPLPDPEEETPENPPPTLSPQSPVLSPVLNGINLTIEPGETVAIMGLIGAGKSTLIQALPRLIEVPAGQVFVGGADVLDLPLDKLRSLVAVVPQDAFLFSMTLAENISYSERQAGNGEVEDRVRRWSKVAHLDDEVNQFPQGYQTLIGERGVTLSGGQRQRATIARALYTGAPIVIFDDSFSSIDTHTEWAILEDLHKGLKGRTILLVTHRVATAQRADRIVVLEAGRITEMGKHAELVARGGLYSRLNKRQQLVQEVEAL